jgi:hypothetical protein
MREKKTKKRKKRKCILIPILISESKTRKTKIPGDEHCAR